MRPLIAKFETLDAKRFLRGSERGSAAGFEIARV
jgi:hypothetical protein